MILTFFFHSPNPTTTMNMMIPTPTWRLYSSLKKRPSATWGFAIYRTACSPHSHLQFPQVMELINSSIKKSAVEESLGCESVVYKTILSRYRPVIMDDPSEFAGLSLADVRSHFETYTEDRKARGEWDGISRCACVVVDDEVLRVVTDAVAKARTTRVKAEEAGEVVDEPRTRYLNGKAWWVKTVEAWPDLDETHDDYDGSMNCSVFALWRLWQWASDPHPLASLMRDENGAYIG
ncbi:hypothetical protein BJX66DRAFT_307012 [Aspergillus keveii]|uniref:Uncharacterized protein n=1 Tax=Aspergillus keveii TaxID=714993 RepID=A0ABR4G1G6_9EURO